MSAFRMILAALALSALPAHAHDGIHLEDAYARTTPRSAAVFMTITNHGGTEDRLLSARTEAAGMAGLHTHAEDANGVMTMPDVPDGFAIPGQSTHALARGGDHVMLMGLTKPLKQGDTIRLVLTFGRVFLRTQGVLPVPAAPCRVPPNQSFKPTPLRGAA